VVCGDREKGWLPFGRVGLGGLADGTTLDIVSDKLAQLGPPVVSAQQLASFENSRVANGGGIVI
jgi:hypothetical protein